VGKKVPKKKMPYEFSGCFSILLCPCLSVAPLKLRSYHSQLLLKAMLQLVEEALLDDRILSSTELPEQVVRQHARKRWLWIRGLFFYHWKQTHSGLSR
jgi:hypothetical protein